MTFKKIPVFLKLTVLFASLPAFAGGLWDVTQYGPDKFLARPTVQTPTDLDIEGTVVQMQSLANENQTSRSCQAFVQSSSLQEVRLTSSDPFTRPGQDGFEPAAAREALGCRVLYHSLAQNKAVKITSRTVTLASGPVTPSSLEFRTDTVMNSSPTPVDSVTCINNQCTAKGLIAKINYPQEKSAPLCTATVKARNTAGQVIDSQISVRIPTAFGIEWRWLQPDQARLALNAKVSLCDLLTAAQDANLPVSVTGTGNEANVNLVSATLGDMPDMPAAQ